ncbi:hypothetical protein F2Q69_00043309 [Brassica cretica]|uniref:Uncharacterized protein n=1 Tax=Brassica cretica TaxID=69181 RepID=A0A8S9NQ52_BRACR|nr:hypothetical protein F2Q69_00043309 [Brassica cretica]
MSGNTKDKVAVRQNAGKTTPEATAPMANAYGNATFLEKIENLAATFRHRKCNKKSSRFLCLNIKETINFIKPHWQQPKRGQESREVQEESIFWLFKMGRQTQKEKGQMSKQNGEEANPNLREN